MAKAGALRTLGPQTTPTGKRSWAARRRLTTASGSACAGLAGRGHQDGRSHGDQSQRPLCGAGPGGGGSGSGTSPTGCFPAWSLVSSNSGRWGVVCVPYYRPACASRGPPTLLKFGCDFFSSYNLTHISAFIEGLASRQAVLSTPGTAVVFKISSPTCSLHSIGGTQNTNSTK